MKIERLMTILVILLSKKYVKAKEIADLFHVNVRTIYRDMDTLSLAGIPIYSKQGNDGGFYLDEGYKLNTVFFSDSEKKLISDLSQSLSASYHLPKLEELNQKMSYLKETQGKESPYFFDISLWKTNQVAIEQMEKAIEMQKVLSFTYTSYKSQTTYREVEPINLVCKSHVWYLYAFCQLRQEYRLFRINRIRSTQLLDKKFTTSHPPMANKSELDNYYNEMTKNIEMIPIHLIFDIKVKGRVYDHFLEKDIDESEGKLIVKKEMPFENWLIEFLLGFGGSVQVVEPLVLRKKLIFEAKEILKQYDIRVSK